MAIRIARGNIKYLSSVDTRDSMLVEYITKDIHQFVEYTLFLYKNHNILAEALGLKFLHNLSYYCS